MTVVTETLEAEAAFPSAIGTLGAGWGIALWFVAAGVVMPVWLRSAVDTRFRGVLSRSD